MHTHMQKHIINFQFSYMYPYVNTEAPSHTSSFLAHVEDTVTLLPTLRSHYGLPTPQTWGRPRDRTAGKYLRFALPLKQLSLPWVLQVASSQTGKNMS